MNRFVGVSDIASVRFSLPAQLLEPTPNLGTPAAPFPSLMLCPGHCQLMWLAEYWNYLDRPETFIAYAILGAPWHIC